MENLSEIQINELTNEILQLKQETAINIMEIGKRLIQVKDSLKHGEFGKYLEEKVDFSTRTAQRYIKVYTEFSNSPTLSNIEPSKLIALLDIKDKNNREQFIQKNNIEDMSVRQISKAVKTINKAYKEATELHKTNNNIITPVEFEVVEEPVNANEDELFDIWVSTITLKNKIKLRTGNFYNDINSNLKLSDAESLLVTRYLNNEITHMELKQVIEQEKLNIPFMQNEENYKAFIEDLNICNSYGHLKENANGDYTYCYDVLESQDLSYDNVVLYTWESNEKDRQQYIKEDKYTFTDKNITIARGYTDNTEYICIYKDKVLFAHYNTNGDYLHKIRDLFIFYKINKKYLKLVEQFIEQKEKDILEEVERKYKKAKLAARLYFEKDNECYVLSEYANERDCIKLFINHEETVCYAFDIGMWLYDSNFYNEILVSDFVKYLKDKSNISLKYINEFYLKLKAEALRLKKEREKQQKKFEEEFHKNFNLNGYADKKAEANIDIFTTEEKKLLKEILTNEKIAKKLYQMSAMEYHPDKVAMKNKEEKQQAEEKMKLLNAINSKIVS